MYKLDKQLFRRNTRGASSDIITKFQFADDVVLLTTTQEAAEVAINTYQSVTSPFGLTISLPRTKFMVANFDIRWEEKEPSEVEGGAIECAESFQ